MKNIIYKYDKKIDEIKVKRLYKDAGWISYTNDLANLNKAIELSLMVITAWDGDELVGLIRVVGDGLSIIYIQDVLVLETYKRAGIGSRLMKIVLDHYTNVRQKVLITEDSEATKGFYKACGFRTSDELGIVCFYKV